MTNLMPELTASIDLFISHVKFNSDGLVTTIAQDADSGEVLMLAWQNEESLRLTLEKNEMVYFSRSRQRLWHKGETSGHSQILLDIAIDCDGDAILARVQQQGDIACHTGRKSCFYRRFNTTQGLQEIYPVLKDPSDIYKMDSHKVNSHE